MLLVRHLETNQFDQILYIQDVFISRANKQHAFSGNVLQNGNVDLFICFKVSRKNTIVQDKVRSAPCISDPSERDNYTLPVLPLFKF